MQTPLRAFLCFSILLLLSWGCDSSKSNNNSIKEESTINNSASKELDSELILFEKVAEGKIKLNSDSFFYKLEQQYLSNIEITKLGRLYGLYGRFWNKQKFNRDSTILYKKKAASLFIEHSDSINYFTALSEIGNAYFSVGEYNEALVYFEKAISLEEFLGDKNQIDFAHFYSNLGALYNEIAEFKKAEELLRKSLTHFDSQDTLNPKLFFAMNNLGLTYEKMGDFLNAEKIFQEAIRKAQDLSTQNLEILAFLYNNWGMAHLINNDYYSGLEYCTVALELRKKIHPEIHPDLANSFHNVGLLNLRINKNDIAIDFLHKSVFQIKNTLGDKHGFLSFPYERLALAFNKKEQFDSSMYYIDKALEVRNSGSNKPSQYEGYIWKAKGWIELQNKKYKSAENSLIKSIEIYQKRSIKDYSSPLILLSKVYLLQNNLAKTDSTIKIIENIYGERLENFYSDGDIWYMDFLELKADRIIKDCHELQCIENALSLYQQKIKMLDHNFSSYNHKSSKSLIINSNYPIFEKILQWHSHQNYPFDEMFFFKTLEGVKARVLKEVILVESSNLLPENLKLRLNELTVDIDFLIGKMSSSDLKFDSSEIEKNIFQLKKQKNILLDSIKNEYPDFYNLRFNEKVISISSIQDSLLEDNQALIEYFVGDSSIFVFTIQKDTFHINQIKKDFPLKEWTEEMLKGIYEPFTNKANPEISAQKYTEATTKLYKKIFEPIDKLLPEGTELIIVPDGVLGYIPFDALLIKTASDPTYFRDHHYLIQDHQISYAYSATLLQEMKNRKHRKKASKGFLAYAPIFGPIPEDSTEAENKIYAYNPTRSSDSRDWLTPLEFNIEEAEAIQQKIGGKVVKGIEATKASFVEEAEDYQILHLSTHAKANDQMGDYAYLAFAETNDSTENERLYNSELYNLPINAEMVVLSACETGIGELQRGEGIISLARGFSYAGAKSIITSLWKVNDKSSRDLMEDFYKNINDGMTKDAALRKAKLDYLENASNYEPFYWAAFIPIGDMSPIELNSGFSYWWLVLVACLGGFVWWYFKRK